MARGKLVGREKGKRREREPLIISFTTLFRPGHLWHVGVNYISAVKLLKYQYQVGIFSRDYFRAALIPYARVSNPVCKSGSVDNTRFLPRAKMLLVPVNIFYYRWIMLWRALDFD